MIAKVKSSNFIDTLKVELLSCTNHCLKAVLRDETGSVCSELETMLITDQPEITWKGLNDLPYGVYTLELSQGEEEIQLRMVKRI
ncbi:MAG: hypothetical protein H7122_16510 [Chitinophagaceae bacterium]|nr:hypothetical protein [Chitinophagaceae bacterium]